MLAWLDDLLGYAKDTKALLVIMRKMFSICREKGLKLNPLRCSFWETEAKWCGRIISGSGAKHWR